MDKEIKDEEIKDEETKNEETKNEETKDKKHITLYDMLNVEPFKFTLREIEEMMDEELNGPIETMDTDFIALCADTINSILASLD